MTSPTPSAGRRAARTAAAAGRRVPRARRGGNASATASGAHAAAGRPGAAPAPGLPGALAPGGVGARRVPRVAHGILVEVGAPVFGRRRAVVNWGAVGHAADAAGGPGGSRWAARSSRRRTGAARTASRSWRSGAFTFTQNDEGARRGRAPKLVTFPDDDIAYLFTVRSGDLYATAINGPSQIFVEPATSSLGRQRHHQFAGELRVVGARYRIEGLTEGQHYTCASIRTPPRAWARWPLPSSLLVRARGGAGRRDGDARVGTLRARRVAAATVRRQRKAASSSA